MHQPYLLLLTLVAIDYYQLCGYYVHRHLVINQGMGFHLTLRVSKNSERCNIFGAQNWLHHMKCLSSKSFFFFNYMNRNNICGPAYIHI